MEYEKGLREAGTYTEIEIQEKTMLMNSLKSKLMQHHELYRFPVKAELWEDIWDQCINPIGSNWVGGGHQPGADTMDEQSNISYQNKSGQIKGSHVDITSHRLAKQAGPSFNDKLNFISQKHCDKYVLLSRDEKDWKKSIKSYNLMIFDSKLLDFRSLEWSEHIPSKGKNKGKHNGGYIGKGDPGKFSARIDGEGSSNQLHISININYIGGCHKIIIP
tara:strand:+ start:1685 stop:2338 length:654 start_codon:yes stop_codon:yes gene_type:complete